ncbi:MAG TPA: right-handed parallel beta-helix repeat-containing protein [Terriglobales bacterium]|jgi:hypothetical protein|nr:right-handed parallel beta-helix repeat-containing protein [Terriglobales bacterium]
MRKMSLLILSTLMLLGSTLLSAQATRTWVSGVGDDANPCSRTAPCKTFAGAISKTAPGGEIDALDPGGFGALTITKSITLDGGGGQVASVLVAGTNGIVVAPGPTDVVIIRNLRLDGLLGNGSNSGNAGINGIRWISGKALYIENCVIFGFNNNGIDIAKSDGGKAFVNDTVVTNNGQRGLSATDTVMNVQVTVNHSRFEGNLNGIWASDFSTFSVRDSDASGNAGNGYVVQSTSGPSDMNLSNSVASNNGNAAAYVGGGTGTSTARITGVSFFNNSSGLFVTTNGTVQSFGNNYNSGPGGPNGTGITPQ